MKSKILKEFNIDSNRGFLPTIDPFPPPLYISLISERRPTVSFEEPPEKTTILLPLKQESTT